jgi:hypothetical protein
MQSLVFPAIDVSKSSAAQANSLFQDGCKHRLKIAGRAADDLKDFRCRSLLLQRFIKLAGQPRLLVIPPGTARTPTPHRLRRVTALPRGGLAAPRVG